MDEEGNEPQVQEPAEEAQPQPQAPTAEDQLKMLTAQLESEKQNRVKSEESYKGLQRRINQLNDELKRQTDFKTELDGLKQTYKILAAAIAEKQAISEEGVDNMPQGKRQDLLAKFDEIEKTQDAKRKESEARNKARIYQEEADSVYERAKKVFGDNEDALEKVEDRLSQGFYNPLKLERAKAMVEKAEKEMVKKTEQPTEEERIEKEIQRRLSEKSKFKTDTAVPASRGLSAKEVIARYAAGDKSVSDSDYQRAISGA